MKSKDFPKDIPVTPGRVYKVSRWIDWADFLGTGSVLVEGSLELFQKQNLTVNCL